MPAVVDLSQNIFQGMKVYPGHLKTVIFEHATHEETALRFEGGFSFQTTGFLLNDNGPTHVDSFSHLDPDPAAQTIDQMDLELFHGPATCLDVSHVAAHTDITAEHLDAAEAKDGVQVRPGDIVLFHTGTHARYAGDPRYLTDFPGLGESACDWIVQRQVKTFGVDSPTPDNPISKTYPCHMMCRREHKTHYENLTNLDQLIGRRFTFFGFPLKLVGGHGGPTRAVALLD
ncbi:cyclase family protein [Nocardia gamkensis]|uniref:cyclase family protein n=1 Tax=Nocardia gamkensis TaxID=352869 RepID=UPI0036E6ED16